MWKNQNNDQPIIFGLIGCGQVGKLIINSIIPYAIKHFKLLANNVHISTRRPEQIHYYASREYQIYFDNNKLLSQCNFVVIAIPPVIDNWNILEFQFTKENQYIVSLLSTIKLKRLKQLLKLENNIFHTQIDSKLLDQAVLSFIELIESLKPGVFQTQIQEDIMKLINQESYKNFIIGENRILEFIKSFDIIDEQYIKLFGIEKLEFESYIDKYFKQTYSKIQLQYQNFISKMN